ncbi:mitochondrial fission ELM1 family protein [Exilibacterium tricleocarpae]|uniref:mitochondrial fission ELM1 family protein n=1 Tax=Exilibacterium tricleocarpae TaxID=2591008 RepID=UPI0015D35853|nr:mitochondrial fission ELM1 family protein [Exilibacterium tricleocarpae]
MAENALITWFITDDKPGHRHQLEGLEQALGRYTDLHERWIHTRGRLQGIQQALGIKAAPPPHLIVACGHRTHLPALLLRHRYGGRLIVLMRPSLPLRWFDLCVLPQHDPAPAVTEAPAAVEAPAAIDKVLRTEGVLNAITPAPAQDPTQGLVLIGGPSKHHAWDNGAIVAQLQRLKNALPEVQWTLTNSRRTPADFDAAVASTLDAQLTFVPVGQTPPGWLQQQLQQRGCVWVSEDSVSMVYESLSSGARVGLLEVPRRVPRKVPGKAPRKGHSRVTAGIDRLLAARRLTPLDYLVEQGDMLPAGEPLQEADRVAKYIVARKGWLA